MLRYRNSREVIQRESIGATIIKNCPPESGASFEQYYNEHSIFLHPTDKIEIRTESNKL